MRDHEEGIMSKEGACLVLAHALGAALHLGQGTHARRFEPGTTGQHRPVADDECNP